MDNRKLTKSIETSWQRDLNIATNKNNTSIQQSHIDHNNTSMMTSEIESISNIPTQENRALNQTIINTVNQDLYHKSMEDIISVKLLSQNGENTLEFGANDMSEIEDLYLNDLSDIRMIEITNLQNYNIQVGLKAEWKKPFDTTICGFQLDNYNIQNTTETIATDIQSTPMVDDIMNHAPSCVLKQNKQANMWKENPHLREDFNEMFNHIDYINEVQLEAKETKRIIFVFCIRLIHRPLQRKLTTTMSKTVDADSSEDDRIHLNETSWMTIAGRLSFDISRIQTDLHNSSADTTTVNVTFPFQGRVCRSLLRLDVKELYFDDCVPGDSFVKDFTVWNQSEIPLLFRLASSLSTFDDTKDIIICTDYDSGFVITEKILYIPAYSHVRIRVTYRAREVGECACELRVLNLNDPRNVKILKIHTTTNREHHREGLSVRDSSGLLLESGSKLDFGDCYTGVSSSKTLLIKNTTDLPLHIELISDSPKEVKFELKLQQNSVRASQAAQTEELLSPTASSDGSHGKAPLSPTESVKKLVSKSNSFDMDSDEEIDDNDENFGIALQESPKRTFFDDNGMSLDDNDDDMVFDSEAKFDPRSPPISPRVYDATSPKKKVRKYKPLSQKSSSSKRTPSNVHDSTIDTNLESMPQGITASEDSNRSNISPDGNDGSNFVVETIDVLPGAERTLLLWYRPLPFGTNSSSMALSEKSDIGNDNRSLRLTKQSIRVSFRCSQTQGSWQQPQSRVFDRTLGKYITIRARICTSLITVTPSILHLGDCNIGEWKAGSCVVTNHSDLPTVVKPLVMSKAISTSPAEEILLGPRQSSEFKVEIIPRKTNPNYSRMITLINLKNEINSPQVCVRSSNMDAHHVIYHSLFYKFVTPSRWAFLNFDAVAINSVGLQPFDLENITNTPLQLNVQSSDPSRVTLYAVKQVFGGGNGAFWLDTNISRNNQGDSKGANRKSDTLLNQLFISPQSKLNHFSHALNAKKANAFAVSNNFNGKNQAPTHLGSIKSVRRRNSIGSIEEINQNVAATRKRTMSPALRDYLSSNVHPSKIKSNFINENALAVGSSSSLVSLERGKSERDNLTGNPMSKQFGNKCNVNGSNIWSTSSTLSEMRSKSITAALLYKEFDELLTSFEKFQEDLTNPLLPLERQADIVRMIQQRSKLFETLVASKKLVPLSTKKERNIRIPAKSRQRIIAVFTPKFSAEYEESDFRGQMRIERHRIYVTLPAGGNKNVTGYHVGNSPMGHKSPLTTRMAVSTRHPFDSKPSVREFLLKARVCRSIMSVNQKNINFGRITVSSKSSKTLAIRNMSAIPLIYCVEKTGSISSDFLRIKEGEMGVIKAFGTRDICFEFQPTLPGPFEEKLKITNFQDIENSVSVTIKAKVVKREMFKLLQSGQVLSLGKCLVGEKSEETKVVIRNTSRKRREYVIQADPSTFSAENLRPTFFFSLDETPTTNITQAQEAKMLEELEKWEHKLRICTTKKKVDKIAKLNAKISKVKALLRGENVSEDKSSKKKNDNNNAGDFSVPIKVGYNSALDMSYDSGYSDSDLSDSEVTPRSRGPRSDLSGLSSTTPSISTHSNVNSLRFSLEAEATGRIVAYAIFRTSSHTSEAFTDENSQLKLTNGKKIMNTKLVTSLKAHKRKLKRDSTPITGVGKFLLYEQQNKDVVKELQYHADIFLRTSAGEVAYGRAVGRSMLPPHPHFHHPLPPSHGNGSSGPSEANISLADNDSPTSLHNYRSVTKNSDGLKNVNPRLSDTFPSLLFPTQSTLQRSHSSISLDNMRENTTDSTHHPHEGIITKVEPNQFGHLRGSTLLIPIEESPSRTHGWNVSIFLSAEQSSREVEVHWNAKSGFSSLISLQYEILSPDQLSQGLWPSPMRKGQLPVKITMSPGTKSLLHVKWIFATEAGFASTTALASCIGRSALGSISKLSEILAGMLEIRTATTCTSESQVPSISEIPFDKMQTKFQLVSSLEVVLAKSVVHSLRLESDYLDLGEIQLGVENHYKFAIRNLSRRSIKFLLLTWSNGDERESRESSKQTPSAASTTVLTSPSSTNLNSNTTAGGEIHFEHSTGVVTAGSTYIVNFSYKGCVLGQHTDKILLKNLSDRLDTSTINLSVKITRPVYVRIPELDIHSTGNLEVLDVGYCYISPESQDKESSTGEIDGDPVASSGSVQHKFAKVKKLTLVSQVKDTLLLCASSNMKTQCYIYEDPDLLREAIQVVMPGFASLNLYVAFRPRLAADAFKTGASRELVGGIRMQIFQFDSALFPGSDSSNLPSQAPTSVDDGSKVLAQKNVMVAEFTVKFTGIAGVSLGRVTPSNINFGVEYRTKGNKKDIVRDGEFKIVNLSKVLPLQYQISITNNTDRYSDNDESLVVQVAKNYGEVPQGESETKLFRVLARSNGLFRRRILIENTHFRGNSMWVDIVMFVDNGSLRCEVFPSASESISQQNDQETYTQPADFLRSEAMDFGIVNVIPLEQELRCNDSSSSINSESGLCRYRIAEEHSDGPWYNIANFDQPYQENKQIDWIKLPAYRYLKLTNTTNKDLIIRPVSRLPIIFRWCTYVNNKLEVVCEGTKYKKPISKIGRGASLQEARKLPPVTGVSENKIPEVRDGFFWGENFQLQSMKTCGLLFRFAPIAIIDSIPCGILEAGKLHEFGGLIGIQQFTKPSNYDEASHKNDKDMRPRTIKMVNLRGRYGISKFDLEIEQIDLGKVGQAVGWATAKFNLVLKNPYAAPVWFTIANLPSCITCLNAESGQVARLNCSFEDASDINLDYLGKDKSLTVGSLNVPSLRSLILATIKSNPLRSNNSYGWLLAPFSTCTIEMEFKHDENIMPTGAYKFHIPILNLYNPQNRRSAIVHVQIISSFAEVILDPECCFDAPVENAALKHSAYIMPVTVPSPPMEESTSHSSVSNFWFSLHNIFDQELVVNLTFSPTNLVENLLEFFIFSRSSSTLLSSLHIATGESVDIRVVCHAMSSARLSKEQWKACTINGIPEIIHLGTVCLDLATQSVKIPTQRMEVDVYGKILPGKTFVLTSNTVHFQAVPTEVSSVVANEVIPTSMTPARALRDTKQQSSMKSYQELEKHHCIYHLRNTQGHFWLKNPSTIQPLSFTIEPMTITLPGLCLIKGNLPSEIIALIDNIQAVAEPSSGIIDCGKSLKISVTLEEKLPKLLAGKDEPRLEQEGKEYDDEVMESTAALRTLRHNPSWRSISWGSELTAQTSGSTIENLLLLTVHDRDAFSTTGIKGTVEVHLVLQDEESSSLSTNNIANFKNVLDDELLRAAFTNRSLRTLSSNSHLSSENLSAKLPGSTVSTFLINALEEHGGLQAASILNRNSNESTTYLPSVLERITEASGIDSQTNLHQQYQHAAPLLTIRGCTPVDHSALRNVRYLIDLGQHTMRKGGEVEWEITIECLFSSTENFCANASDYVEYKLSVIDHSASAWLRLSRDRGTLDRNQDYQGIVLHFYRDVVGIYSTYLVLQNMNNLSDIKFIYVRIEVIVDPTSLRTMSTGTEISSLFRVLVPSSTCQRRYTTDNDNSAGNFLTTLASHHVVTNAAVHGGIGHISSAGSSPVNGSNLVIDYGDVYYNKLYSEHSIILENSSSFTLDFMLSSNSRSNELSFALSSTSFNEISTVTLAGHTRLQVFLIYRPLSGDIPDGQCNTGEWNQLIEVYVNCRLLKDFRETIHIVSVCHYPQLMMKVVSENADRNNSNLDTNANTIDTSWDALAHAVASYNFPEIVFSVPGSFQYLSIQSQNEEVQQSKFLVIYNREGGSSVLVSIRNNSTFFNIDSDANSNVSSQPMDDARTAQLNILKANLCSGRQPNLYVLIPPGSSATFVVTPNIQALQNQLQQPRWGQSVKEHISIYNIDHPAEYYQVTIWFSCSNNIGFYTPPNIVESNSLSALEDTIAQFLQQFHSTLNRIFIQLASATGSTLQAPSELLQKQSHPTLNGSTQLLNQQVLSKWRLIVDMFDKMLSNEVLRDIVDPSGDLLWNQEQMDNFRYLLRSLHTLIFDFGYIVDELIWYGVQGSALRPSLMLAEMVFGLVFQHDIFRSCLQSPNSEQVPISTRSNVKDNEISSAANRRILYPWIRQLGHYLSYFPDNNHTIVYLMQIYEELQSGIQA